MGETKYPTPTIYKNNRILIQDMSMLRWVSVFSATA